jgi:hypothetical protein
MNDFLFLADYFQAALLLCGHINAMLINFGMLWSPKKGLWAPIQVGDYLGLTIDLDNGKFRTITGKLHTLAKQTSFILGRAVSIAC